MLGEEADPFTLSFLALILPGVISLFAMGFLNRYAWLRDSADVYNLLAIQGVVMVFLGGVGGALQAHLGKLLGYAALYEIGLSLLAISLVDGYGTQLFFGLLLPRALALIVLGLGVSRLSHITHGVLTRESLRSVGWQHPAASISVIIALFSLAGVPLLAAFPIRIGLWSALAVRSAWLAGAALFSGLGLLLAGLRFMLALLSLSDLEKEPNRGPDIVEERAPDAYAETPPVMRWLLYGFGAFLLILFGLFPQWIFPLLGGLQAMFPQLIP